MFWLRSITILSLYTCVKEVYTHDISRTDIIFMFMVLRKMSRDLRSIEITCPPPCAQEPSNVMMLYPHVFGSNLTFVSSNYQESAWPEQEAMTSTSPYMRKHQYPNENEVCSMATYHKPVLVATQRPMTLTSEQHITRTLADLLLTGSRLMVTTLP